MEENDRLSKISVPEKGEDDQFPIGMKVLAIDANIVCLKYLVLLLQKCQYEVTATTEAAEAIGLLKDKKEAFDIVITNVVRLDMDGFKLLEIIGLGMDIPVVLVSANDEMDVVKRGVLEGAEAYLQKPVRLQELRTIWQHVLRKRLRKKSNLNIMKEVEEDQKPNSHERVRDKEDDESDETRNPHDNNVASSSKKKPRVTWSKELHVKFVEAFEQLGEKERVPKNILKLMNEPGLTRENVASHLQKHRDGLRKKKATVGKLVSQKNYYVRNPTKASTIYSSINKRNKASNLSSPSSFSANLTPQLLGSEYPRSTWTATGSYFPVPEFKWLNFPSNYSSSKPCDGYLGFGPNNIDPYYPNPFGSNCLNSTSQTFGHCPIDVGAIPQQEAPIARPFPNRSIAGQCSQLQFDMGSSLGSLMDDDLSEIFKQELFRLDVEKFDSTEVDSREDIKCSQSSRSMPSSQLQ